MSKRYVLAGAVLMTVLVSGVLLAKKSNAPVEPPKVQSLGPRIKGPADAPVEIIEYSDFQCPACQRAQQTLHDLWGKYPGKLRMVYKHFPLSGHQWSAVAHQAAECAAEQNRFWDFHDRLFKDQALWAVPENPTAAFIRYAQELGLDLDAFGSCLSNEAVKKRIMDDKQSGLTLKVNSTPTFFVNGERVVGHVELGLKGEAVIRKALHLEPLPEAPAKAS